MSPGLRRIESALELQRGRFARWIDLDRDAVASERAEARARQRVEICGLVGEALRPSASTLLQRGSRARRFVGVMDRNDPVEQVLVRDIGRNPASAIISFNAFCDGCTSIDSTR